MKLFLYAIFIFLPRISLAQAQVFPTHLTLTEEASSSYLNIKNVTEKTQTYRIELVKYKMSPDGMMKKSAIPDTVLAELIKFSPKKISVAPNEKQIVRVMMTSFEQLKEGDEYIHIHFIPVDDLASKDSSKSKSAGFSLQARIAVAVPIVVRKGTEVFSGELKNLKISKGKAQDVEIKLNLKNKNSFSLYGDLDIFAVYEKEEILLDKTVGLTSYLPERSFTKNISAKELKEKLGDKVLQKIKVQYHSNNESPTPFDLSVEATISEKKSVSKQQ